MIDIKKLKEGDCIKLTHGKENFVLQVIKRSVEKLEFVVLGTWDPVWSDGYIDGNGVAAFHSDKNGALVPDSMESMELDAAREHVRQLQEMLLSEVTDTRRRLQSEVIQAEERLVVYNEKARSFLEKGLVTIPRISDDTHAGP